MQLATPFWEDKFYFRRQSPTALGASAIWYNVLKSSTGVNNVTHSTADPSGGVDGDLWIKYVP